jgi:hypothetical protein
MAMNDSATMHPEERRTRLIRSAPSWTAVAGLLLALAMPVCGWLVTLSNRVSVLEEKTATLATAAQMAEVKTEITDWIAETERDRVADRAFEPGQRK